MQHQVALEDIKFEPYDKKRGHVFSWPPDESALAYASDQKSTHIFINTPQSQFLSMTFDPDVFTYNTDEVESSLDGKFTIISIRKKKDTKMHSKRVLRVTLKLTNGEKVISVPATRYFNRHKLREARKERKSPLAIAIAQATANQQQQQQIAAVLVQEHDVARKMPRLSPPAVVVSVAPLSGGESSAASTPKAMFDVKSNDSASGTTSKHSETWSVPGSSGKLGDKFVMVNAQDLRLETLNGTGGQGLVFRTWFQDRPVAGKILFKGNHYLREKDIAGRMVELNGPHLCRYFAACDALQMILMEWMDNGDLYSRIHAETSKSYVHWSRFGRSILKDVCAAVVFLHRNNIAHRDIKSPNILLTHEWEAKISDFGSASVANAQPDRSLGTLRWASAEQITQPNADGMQCDVWAFGVVVLTQQQPWQGLDDMTVKERILAFQQMPLDNSWPQEFRNLLQSCWQAVTTRPCMSDVQQLLSKCTEHVIPAAPSEAADALFDLAVASSVLSGGAAVQNRASTIASNGMMTVDPDKWAATLLSEIPDIRFDGSVGPTVGPYKLQHPLGVATDAQGRIYITDTSQRVYVLGADGKYLNSFGSRGSEPGQFQEAYGIAVTADLIAVSDYALHCIHLFDAMGKFKRRLGGPGRGPGDFLRPCSVAIDRTGRMAVIDRGNNRVQIFKPDGTFVRKWGELGTGDTQFVEPRSVALDGNGNLVIGDRNFVRVFDWDGRMLLRFMISNSISFVHVTVDGNNNIVISDKMSGTIKVYDTNGKLCTQMGREGDGAQQFRHPKGITFDATSSRIIVADAANDRLQLLRVQRNGSN